MEIEQQEQNFILLEEQRRQLDEQISDQETMLFLLDGQKKHADCLWSSSKSACDEWQTRKMKKSHFLGSYWPGIMHYIKKEPSYAFLIGLGMIFAFVILIGIILVIVLSETNKIPDLASLGLISLFSPFLILLFWYLIRVIWYYFVINPFLIITIHHFKKKNLQDRKYLDHAEADVVETTNILNSLKNERLQVIFRIKVKAAQLPDMFLNDIDVQNSNALITNITDLLDIPTSISDKTQQTADQIIADLREKEADYRLRKANAIQQRNHMYTVNLIKKFLSELRSGDEFELEPAVNIILVEGKEYPVHRSFILQFLKTVCMRIEGFQYVHLKRIVRCTADMIKNKADIFSQIDALFSTWIYALSGEDGDTYVETGLKKEFESNTVIQESSRKKNTEEFQNEIREHDEDDSFLCRVCKNKVPHDDGDYKIAVCEKCLQHFDTYKIYDDFDDGIISEAELKTFDLMHYMKKQDK